MRERRRRDGEGEGNGNGDGGDMSGVSWRVQVGGCRPRTPASCLRRHYSMANVGVEHRQLPMPTADGGRECSHRSGPHPVGIIGRKGRGRA